MSVTFSMAARRLPSPEEFVQAISEGIVEGENADEEAVHLVVCAEMAEGMSGSSWEENHVYTFYLAQLSTRGIQVGVQQGAFNVRIPPMACEDDWVLALQFLEFAAKTPEDVVINDWKIERYPIKNLRQVFETEFVQEAILSQAHTVFTGALEHGEEYDLSGPIINFTFGPWLAQRILSFLDAYALEEDFNSVIAYTHGVMRHVQFFCINFEEEWGVPDLVELPDDDQIYQGAVMRSGCIYVPKTDFLVLPDGKKRFLALPSDDFKEQLPQYFKEPHQLIWLDEHQFALRNVTDKDLKRFAIGVKDICAVLTTR